jgi:hypothetical protein
MTLSLTTMDITDRKERGMELHNVICLEAKRAVNSKLLLPIPNVILLTQDQFDDLSELANGVQPFYHSEDRFYTTPYNIMEVRVDKRKRLTFTEAHSLDDKAFDEWEKSDGRS